MTVKADRNAYALTISKQITYPNSQSIDYNKAMIRQLNRVLF